MRMTQAGGAAGYAGDLTPAQAWELLESDPNAQLIDVRTTAEWNYVGVPDLTAVGRRALLIEWTTFPQGERNPYFVDQLRKGGVSEDTPAIFVCRSGQRSIGAAQAATAAGIARCYNVLDGFEGHLDEHGHRGAAGWRAEGLPWRQF